MLEDQQRWNDRYRSARTGPPRGFLVDVAALLPEAGLALDLACGTGSETLWLARRGLRVDAVDIAAEGLAAARAALAAAGLSERVNLMQADLDEGVPDRCHGPYQLMCALHFRSPVLEQAIEAKLAPGGMVVATRLSVVGRHGAGSGPDPAFLARPGELRDLADRCDLEVLEHAEGDGAARLVARRRLRG